MLPSNLLAVWKRKGAIQPRYAKPTADNLEVAKTLIETYSRNVGEKKKTIKELVGELEESGYEYRFVRGLSFLLDRRSIFTCHSDLNPIELRRQTYQLTEKSGIPTTPERRSQIIAAVASELSLPAETVEQSLYADLDSELILEKSELISPQNLLKEYNLSLTQTLLFDSTVLDFTASGNWQRIFYTIKRLGLIYEASLGNGFSVRIDGPASLFKLTRRYGVAVAKLLPVIVANPVWTIKAKILWKYTNEICSFEAESWKHGSLLKQPQLPAVTFDSAVEEDFAARFSALETGWNIKREPEPVPAGKAVIIPDFSLERESLKVYLEIVGFWTAEYLQRKIEKLGKVEVNMIVAIDENLVCEKLSNLKNRGKLNILLYRDRIPLAPVLGYLNKAFEEVRENQESFLRSLPIVFTEPVLSFREFAARIGLSVEAVTKALAQKPPRDYMVLPRGLVRRDTLESIGRKIDEQMGPTGRLPLPQVTEMIESEGVEDSSGLLEALKYRIVWHGISTEKAEVTKA